MTASRWEYRFEAVHLDGKDGAASRQNAIAALDELGEDRWEAVGLLPSHASSRGLHVETTEFVVLFKREQRRARTFGSESV
jgi:hypothetical protein